MARKNCLILHIYYIELHNPVTQVKYCSIHNDYSLSAGARWLDEDKGALKLDHFMSIKIFYFNGAQSFLLKSDPSTLRKQVINSRNALVTWLCLCHSRSFVFVLFCSSVR